MSVCIKAKLLETNPTSCESLQQKVFLESIDLINCTHMQGCIVSYFHLVTHYFVCDRVHTVMFDY